MPDDHLTIRACDEAEARALIAELHALDAELKYLRAAPWGVSIRERETAITLRQAEIERALAAMAEAARDEARFTGDAA